MVERDQIGREKYGVPLQAGNGRDPLVDLYQEILDAAVYIRQAIEERKAKVAVTLRFPWTGGKEADPALQLPFPGRDVAESVLRGSGFRELSSAPGTWIMARSMNQGDYFRAVIEPTG